jgi:predicted secreted hydrolase
MLPLSCLARQFKQALPGYIYAFPRDHASHDEYKTEWWYFTGHLESEAGTTYGYELTFFRTASDKETENSNTWNLNNIYFAHFAITDPNKGRFFYTEKLNRSGLSSAGAREDSCYVFNQLWSMELLGNDFVIRADVPEFGIHLILSPSKKPTIHGIEGVSQKASCKGCASHYYSSTRLETAGTLFVNGKANCVKGISWMDHEFGSNQLTAEQIGWDWFSIQLNSNEELMLYMMRRKDGSIDPNSSGTLIRADGSSRHLKLDDFSVKSLSFWKSEKTGGTYPMNWNVNIPSESIKLNITPVMKNQELAKTPGTNVTYWEGASLVTGSVKNKPIEGKAYVEMTGYAENFHQNI